LLRKQQKTLGGYFFLPHPVDNECMKMLKVTKFQYFIFSHCRKNTHKNFVLESTLTPRY